MDCLFCKIIKNEISSEKIYEDGDVLAFMDIGPVNNGHVLVIPKEHVENYLSASDEMLAKCNSVIKKITPVILEAVRSSGWNLGVNSGKVSGQVIFHLHFHIMPRFENDGLRLFPANEDAKLKVLEVAEKIRQYLKSEN